MAEKTLPQIPETFIYGMDSYNAPKKMGPNVSQSLINAFPGDTIKPLNGVNDVMVKNSFLTDLTNDLEENVVNSIVEFTPFETTETRIYISCGPLVYQRQDNGSWVEVFDSGNPSETIMLYVFSNKLWAAGTLNICLPYSNNGYDWTTDNVVNVDITGINSIVEFDSYLYVGCYYSVGSVGKIFRSSSGTGSWALLEDGMVGTVGVLIEFNSVLYALDVLGNVFSTTDGTAWVDVADLGGNSSLMSAAVFDGYLYMVHNTATQRSADGTNWSASLFTNAFSITAKTNEDFIYIGDLDGDIHRSSDGTSWTQIITNLDSNSMYLTTINNNIYIGTTVNGYVYILDYRPSLFRPHTEFVNKNDKDYLFQWSRDVDSPTKFALEIWNITDDTLEQFIYGTWPSTDVYFSMLKLYDSIYLSMNYEMSANPGDPYQTKNKIIEWDTTTSTWVIRESGIDIAASFGEIDVIDAAENAWAIRSGHRVVEFLGKLWMIGGAKGVVPYYDFYSSVDGVTWDYAGSPPTFAASGAQLVVYKNKMWWIGGYTGSGYSDNVYSTVDGITWVTETLTAAFGLIAYHKVVVYNGKMWLTGGYNDTAGGTYNDDTWYSEDGITWTSSASSPSYGDRESHGFIVYDNKMWVIAGSRAFGSTRLNDVYYSSDGITWTQATAAAAFAVRTRLSAVVYRGKMWVIAGYHNDGSSIFYNDVYSSIDGITWTLESASVDFSGRDGAAIVVFNDFIWIFGGRFGTGSSDYLNDKWVSSEGVLWYEQFAGLSNNLYREYACTFVRRKDDISILQDIDDYTFEAWEDYSGGTLVGTDEKLLTGVVSFSGGTLTGNGTLFSSELVVGQYIRVDGTYEKGLITLITNDALATVSGLSTSTLKKFSLLPSVGDPITVNIYHPGVVEGIEDIDNRRTIYVVAPSGQDARARVLLQTPLQADIDKAVSHGATHLRIYRTLGNESKTIVQGLSKRFLVDVALFGSGYDEFQYYRDGTTEDELTFELNFLDITGYSVPPLGRFSIWAGEVWWIGGNPDNPGYWYHSVRRGTEGVAFNTAFPQKYASMFDLDVDYKTVDPADGQKDSGCAVLMGDLYFFKERKIFVQYNSDPKNIPVKVHHSIGCVCPQSIINADIPALGGQCVLFESDSGPAYLSQGGRVTLLTDYTISELWPDKTGILKRSNKTKTDWYSRNKVTCAYWQNTWWFFFGDGTDTDSQLGSFKCFGFHFSNDGEGIGPFEKTFAQLSDTTVYEPQLLFPVDNDIAYTFSHHTNVAGERTYRCTKFLDATKWLDTYDEGTGQNYFGFLSRYLFQGIRNRQFGDFKKLVLFIDFVDTTSLTVTIRADKTRLTSTVVYSKEIQTGTETPTTETFRNYINFNAREGDLYGTFFDVLVSKGIPSDGNAEINGFEIVTEDREREGEYIDGLGESTGNTTFIVEVGTTPEVDAHP